MRSGIEPVQFEVLASEEERGAVAVHARHLRRSVKRQRQREPARVREAVERVPDPSRVSSQGEAVLALVEEEASLLSGPDVDREDDAVLAHDDVLGRLASPQHPPAQSPARFFVVAGVVFVRVARFLVAAIDTLERDLAA